MIILRMSCVNRQWSASWKLPADALGQLRKLDAVLFGKIPDGDLVVAFRNVLAHGYATLDHRRVYEIASSRAGELLKTLETLLVADARGVNDNDDSKDNGIRIYECCAV